MTKEFISIQDAAELSKKSIQTIRRAIKAKKLTTKKQKTPQGFNYLINLKSLCSTYKIKMAPNVKAGAKKKTSKPTSNKSEVKNEITETRNESKKEINITAEDFRTFTKNLEKMINQHSEERQNFLRLVNSLQEKIFVLENQLNLLKEPQKKWYQVWK